MTYVERRTRILVGGWQSTISDGHREILGLQATSAEDGAGWLALLRDLTARGLTGVRLVTSDAHSGLTAAIGATLPDASCQRCRTHYAANLMSVTPKASWPWVKTLLHSARFGDLPIFLGSQTARGWV